MMKKNLFILITAAIALATPAAFSFSKVSEKLTQSTQSQLVHADKIFRNANLTPQNEPTMNSDREVLTVTDAQSSQNYVEGVISAQGLKPGKAPSYKASAEELEIPLTFVGMLQYSSINGEIALPYGFYKFSTENGLVREPYADVDACINIGGVYVGERLHGISNIPLNSSASSARCYYCWDTDTWAPRSDFYGETMSSLMGCNASDPETGEVFNFYFSEFRSIDFDNLTTTTIAESDSYANIKMFAIGKDHQGFVVDGAGYLSKVDLTSGGMTKIGQLDFTPMFALQDMIYDARTDRFFMCVSEIVEDKDYFLGRLCELNVDDATTRLIGYLPQNEEYTCLKLLYTPTPGCPASVNDLTAMCDKDSNEGTLSFSLPTQSVDGTTLSSSLDYMVQVGEKELKRGTANPGEKLLFDFQTDEVKHSKVVVVVSNEIGESERCAVPFYVGTDTPMASNVSLTVDTNSNEATLTWTAERGEHNGYIDTDNQTFTIVRYPDGETVASNIRENSFSESFEDAEYMGLYYEVTASIGDVAGEPVNSNIVKFGNPLSVPYVENFNNKANFTSFDVIDLNNDGSTWEVVDYEVSRGNIITLLRYKFNVEHSADDWVLTPPLSLKEGMVYELAFKAAAVSENYPEVLEVGFGTGEVRNYEIIQSPTEIKNSVSELNEWKNQVEVKKDGIYHFGFHAISERNMHSLFIDDIYLTELCSVNAPNKVENIAVTAAPEGDLSASIEFDAPTTTFSGENLSSISYVEIFRDGEEVVTTISNVEPGRHYSVVDEDAVNGLSRYCVVAYNENGGSIPVYAEAYIGEDAPYSPQNLTVKDNLDGSLTLSWETPNSIGTNGGYVDVNALAYTLYSISEEGILPIAEEISDTSFLIDDVDQTGDQKIMYFAVDAYNEVGRSEKVDASIVTGNALQIPYMEGFVPGKFAGLWYTMSNEPSNNGFDLFIGTTPDRDGYLVGYNTSFIGGVSKFCSGKISILNAANPMLAMGYYSIPGADNRLSVFVHRNGATDRTELLKIDFKSESGEEGWRIAKANLSDFKDAEYLTFDFEAEITDANDPMVFFDDINIRDVKTDDLIVYLDAQTHATRGEELIATATVHNIGDRKTGDFIANLYVNGDIVARAKGSGLDSFVRGWVEFKYKPGIEDPDNTLIWVESEYSEDADESNDISEHQSVAIIDPLLNIPQDLTAEVSDDGIISLSWNAVEEVNDVVESFEGYGSFMKEEFGEWITMDVDGKRTDNVSGVYFKGMETPTAFMTFDFSVADIDLSEYPEYNAHTGTQCIAAFPSVSPPNNDWIISPKLSGEAQTIRLYARTLGNSLPDTFDVYYSIEGTAVESFAECVGSAEVDSEEYELYEFDLPEGAIYFAIQCNSIFGGMLMIDDVAYQGAPLTLEGYNIYRDGELYAKVGADTTDYNEPMNSDAKHTYMVTALFKEGESGASNRVEVTNSGVITLEADKEVEFYDMLGRKLSRPSNGITIVKDKKGGHKVMTK